MRRYNAGMLKLVRLVSQLTMRELADEIGVSVNTIERIENAGWSNATWDRHAEACADALGVTTDELQVEFEFGTLDGLREHRILKEQP